MIDIPTGIRLFCWEHGALWPLSFKGYNGEGETLGYANRSHGPLPKSSEVEVRWVDPAEYRHADRLASELEKKGWRVLVVKGMPSETEVGSG